MMKKSVLSLGLVAAAAFILTNCTHKIDNPVGPSVEGVPFEIVASPAATRTINDGVSTVWATGDAINLFHKAYGSEDYENDGKFEFVEGNRFKGTLTEELSEGSCYDLYALYPYNSDINTPDNWGPGFTIVGSPASWTQKQTGNNSTAHIAGEHYPLCGTCHYSDGGSGEPVQIKMSHMSSLLEVVVKNKTGKPLVVESVAFVGSESIVGKYYVDLTGKTPVFRESGINTVSKTAKLEVHDGEPIPDGETAKFYLAVKPFTAIGDITLAVNNIARTKNFTAPAEPSDEDVSVNEFAAGRIKTLNFTMQATDVLEKSNIEDVAKLADNTVAQIEGVVIAKHTHGILIQDETGIMLAYKGSIVSENVGDKVNVTGVKSRYAGFPQLKTPEIKVLSTGHPVTHPTPAILDAAGMYEQAKKTSISYIQYTGYLRISGNYHYVHIPGTSTAIGIIRYPLPSLNIELMDRKTVTVTGYFIGVTSGSTNEENKYLETLAVSIEAV